MTRSRRPFRAPPLNKRPVNVLNFEPSSRKRKAWWEENWPYGALVFAPIIGIAVAWLWQTSPTEIPPAGGSEQYEVAFSRCSGPIRVTCVVDGDTIWLKGQKIRIADINTPEVSSPDCPAERALGERATSRLTALLNKGGFRLRAIDRDEDRYGRKLRIITRNGQSLGSILVNEGLAENWTGSRRSWC
ncbi:thermonuclease family protein [Altererythrobacter luteolus]|uniref:Thermonuclease family protein n=1 Tax=Pontixanthobacter luteolus TaxID=295089 RepID=A0A6I4V0K0_9SPHN|nr:thermonuclease family protein [Pontixanthobacter luteolus]